MLAEVVQRKEKNVLSEKSMLVFRNRIRLVVWPKHIQLYEEFYMYWVYPHVFRSFLEGRPLLCLLFTSLGNKNLSKWVLLLGERICSWSKCLSLRTDLNQKEQSLPIQNYDQNATIS